MYRITWLLVLHQYLHHRSKGLWNFADFSQWLVAFEGNYSPSAELVPLEADLTTQKTYGVCLQRLSKPNRFD
jgi:hypothetical protein